MYTGRILLVDRGYSYQHHLRKIFACTIVSSRDRDFDFNELLLPDFFRIHSKCIPLGIMLRGGVGDGAGDGAADDAALPSPILVYFSVRPGRENSTFFATAFANR